MTRECVNKLIYLQEKKVSNEKVPKHHEKGNKSVD